MNSLQEAILQRDKALAEFEWATSTAEAARERWIEYSTQVAILRREMQSREAHIAPSKVPLMRPNPVRGICAAVAKELGLSHEHVRQVAYGMRVSERVSDALRTAQRMRGIGVDQQERAA